MYPQNLNTYFFDESSNLCIFSISFLAIMVTFWSAGIVFVAFRTAYTRVVLVISSNRQVFFSILFQLRLTSPAFIPGVPPFLRSQNKTTPRHPFTFLRHASCPYSETNPLSKLRFPSPLDGVRRSDLSSSRSAVGLLPRCNWRAAVYLSDVTLLAPVYWMEGRQRGALCDLPASGTLFERKRRPPRTGLVPYTTTACPGGSRTGPSAWNVSKICLETTFSERAARLKRRPPDCQIASHCSFNTLTAIPRLSVKHQTVLPFGLRRNATSEYPIFGVFPLTIWPDFFPQEIFGIDNVSIKFWQHWQSWEIVENERKTKEFLIFTLLTPFSVTRNSFVFGFSPHT